MRASRLASILTILLTTQSFGEGSKENASPSAKPTSLRPRRGQALVPLHGLAIQIHRTKNAVSRTAPLIRQVAELGANSVALSISGYQKHAGSWRIRNHKERTPHPDDMEELFVIAQANDLRIIFMPKILLSEPRGSEWRGRIQPPSWADWFDQYRRFIVEWARVAERSGVEIFVVGSELVSTEKKTDRWRRIIRDVREVYSGQLAYSANWDHYSKLEFWDRLDLVGITTYYTLSDKPLSSADEMVEAWRPIKKRILDWQKKVGKPLLFTEVGWPSQPGCAVEPWNYYRFQAPSPEGVEEQRRCYQAFTKIWRDVPQLAGTVWWEWTTDAGGPDDFGYSPKGKPAERVLRKWFEHETGGP
jgi:hypothetical protein